MIDMGFSKAIMKRIISLKSWKIIILHLGFSNLKIGFKKGKKNDTVGNQEQVLVFFWTAGVCS